MTPIVAPEPNQYWKLLWSKNLFCYKFYYDSFFLLDNSWLKFDILEVFVKSLKKKEKI